MLSALLADPAPLRRRWHETRRRACDPQGRHPLPPGLPVRMASPIGTGLSRRLELLFRLDPRPAGIPDPPPWDTADLYGFPWRATPFLRESRGRDLPWQEVAAAELVARAEKGPIELRWALPRSLTPAEQILAFAHLDELTATAAEVLLPALADRTLVGTKLGTHLGSRGQRLAPGIPDLAFRGLMVEVKASSRPELPRDWLVQLATYILMDLDDEWGIEEAAIYQARWGLLFRFGLGELIAGAGTSRGLSSARERYRQVRDSHQTLHTQLEHRFDDENADPDAAELATRLEA